MATTLVQPDTQLIKEVVHAGGDFKKCYQCATCASTCGLSTEENAFPRKQMLLAQWGMKDELMQDPSPWLCFYCGDCSKMCPRQASPGESMMALRRYLTTQYDWTGLSRLMYGSAFWEIGVLFIVAAMVVALFVVPQGFGFHLLAEHPEAQTQVMLNYFAPAEIVHHADQIMALLLTFFLLSNAARMFTGLTKGRDIPLGVYISHLPDLLLQGVTQKRWKDCKDPDAATNWIRHLFLVTGYVTIFTLVALFLPYFQVSDNSFRWTSILGYYSTAVLMVTTAWILTDRMSKRTEMHHFSHLSDWLFPILLFLTALTGIGVHVLRLTNQAMATYYMYMIHLAIAVPMLVVEVPFGKWAHLLYRPLAIYVAAVRKEVEPAGQRALAAHAAEEA